MEFSVSCKVINKKDGFRSRITTVYGDADESRKQDFLDELDTFSVCTSTPCIWGDSNLVRYQKDKSNDRVHLRWCEKFNSWIDALGLLEINLLGRSFTWSNNQDDPSSHILIGFFAALILMSTFPWLLQNLYLEIPVTMCLSCGRLERGKEGVDLGSSLKNGGCCNLSLNSWLGKFGTPLLKGRILLRDGKIKLDFFIERLGDGVLMWRL
jgi:hypothetical protein